ncbi:amino acid permease [Staphylococcus saprophyticus]|uniref:amino acid permease n=1 Tax=Staphylococcus saprophyticus TaxID=29385 RepID=UPI0028A39DE1|nr:amino acid permease [Staphylococcus saprophyticus]MDT3967137.1 amino acid permease [Staphylococcus saprophyticus]MDT3971764.1 amino acid permease [Staphylococcus saprophyticus]MDT3978648.1 amino acid permease [Staphylococcus saprophyticus]MDT3985608.1 amino acid permease [Staphylococcus saprophyticus]MDT3998345.1 amino acid permease [Staphylococcus saprophyticus]
MEQTSFKRAMKQRHLMLLSFGGVIGTGLFLSSGYTLQQAGPLGTVLSYIVGSILVYLVMLCLGQLAIKHPVTGGFHTYASKYIHPSIGYIVAWFYWLTWTVALGSEFTAVGILMQRWFPEIPEYIFAASAIILVLIFNIISTRFYAEVEFYFSLVKVVTIIVFIILGICVILGLIHYNGYEGIHTVTNRYTNPTFPNGIGAVFLTMLAVNYAFSGTELIGIAAGETENPKQVIPKAIRATLWRLIIFFIGTMVIISILIPSYQGKSLESPFVVIFQKMGIPYAGDIMNLVIITALLSAANSGLYAASRMIWSLANEGVFPKWFGQLNKYRMPINATLFSMVGGLLALLSSIYAVDSLYVVLVSIAGLAVVIVWMSICVAYFNAKRYDPSLKIHQSIHIIGFILCLVSCIGMVFDSNQAPALYFGVPFAVIALIYYFIKYHKKRGN